MIPVPITSRRLPIQSSQLSFEPHGLLMGILRAIPYENPSFRVLILLEMIGTFHQKGVRLNQVHGRIDFRFDAWPYLALVIGFPP